MMLGRFIVGGANAEVGPADRRVNFIGMRGIAKIDDETMNSEVGLNFEQPSFRKERLRLTDITWPKEMSNDVVFLINIGLDQCDFRNAPIARNQIEHRHAAAAGANLHNFCHAFARNHEWKSPNAADPVPFISRDCKA